MSWGTCYNLTAPLVQGVSTFTPDNEGFYCIPYA